MKHQRKKTTALWCSDLNLLMKGVIIQHHQVENELVPNPTHPKFLTERFSGTDWESTLWVQQPIEFSTPSLLPGDSAPTFITHNFPPLNVIAFTNPLNMS